MRSQLQERPATGEVVHWKSDFLPAIRSPVGDPDSVRLPKWFPLKYNFKGEVLLCRVLDGIGMGWHIFKFVDKPPRKPPVVRSWLPGYMFVHFDAAVDRWQQLLDMPHVIGLMGMPPLALPEEGPSSMDELRKRLSYRLGKAESFATHHVGQEVMVMAGMGAGFTGMVTWSSPKRVKVIVMMFGQPVEAELDPADVKPVKG